MHASSPGRLCPGGPSPGTQALAEARVGSSLPACEKLPSHVVHDDAARDELDALVKHNYPCAVVRGACCRRRRRKGAPDAPP